MKAGDRLPGEIIATFDCLHDPEDKIHVEKQKQNTSPFTMNSFSDQYSLNSIKEKPSFIRHKAVAYNDISTDNDIIMLQENKHEINHFHMEEIKKKAEEHRIQNKLLRQEQIYRTRKENSERQSMTIYDNLSLIEEFRFRPYEASTREERLVAKYLEKQKSKEHYLKWSLPLRCLRRYDQASLKKEIQQWNCIKCHFQNNRFVNNCEKCQELFTKDTLYGTWELTQGGNRDSLFSPGFYRIQKVKKVLKISEFPPRVWFSSIIVRNFSDLNKLHVVLQGQALDAELNMRNNEIKWSNGAILEKKEGIIIKVQQRMNNRFWIEQPYVHDVIQSKRPPSNIRTIVQLQRAIADQQIDGIVNAMSNSQETSYMGCLALGKCITEKVNISHEERNTCQKALLLALDSYPNSNNIANASLTALYWLHFQTTNNKDDNVLPSLLSAIDVMISLKTEGVVLMAGSKFILHYLHQNVYCMTMGAYCGASSVLCMAIEHPSISRSMLQPHLSAAISELKLAREKGHEINQ